MSDPPTVLVTLRRAVRGLAVRAGLVDPLGECHDSIRARLDVLCREVDAGRADVALIEYRGAGYVACRLEPVARDVIAPWAAGALADGAWRSSGVDLDQALDAAVAAVELRRE